MFMVTILGWYCRQREVNMIDQRVTVSVWNSNMTTGRVIIIDRNVSTAT